MQELDYAPYDYQQDFHNSPFRFSLIVGGRRVGKSKMALMELVRHCLETPKAMAWWVAPTFTMAREVGWEEFKEYKDVLEPAIDTIHETLLRVRFKNGSQMYFKGADNERSLRGRGLTYLVMDEAAFIEPHIWSRALRPALSDRQGKCLLISTPNGRNWFYDQAAFASNKDTWGYGHWPTQMNPLISESELMEAAATVSEMDFRQEYMAEFVSKEGMVYDDFNEENIVDQVVGKDLKDYDIYLGIDFGYANPSAICFMAVDPLGNEVIQFDEIYVARTNMDDIIAMIVATLRNYDIDPSMVRALFTDPAGNAAELSSGISPVDSLRMCDHRFKVHNKGSEIAPGIAKVRSFVRASDGKRKYFVTNNCMETIRSISGYTYARTAARNETIKEEAFKDGIHDHMCDAVRYFFVNCFDENKWITEVPEQYNYGIDLNGYKRPVMKTCPECHRKFTSRTSKHMPPYICRECNGEQIDA